MSLWMWVALSALPSPCVLGCCPWRCSNANAGNVKLCTQGAGVLRQMAACFLRVVPALAIHFRYSRTQQHTHVAAGQRAWISRFSVSAAAWCCGFMAPFQAYCTCSATCPGASVSLGLRNELLHAWMLWRLVDLLSADRLSPDLACIGFTVSHHRRQLLLQGLRDVQPILRDYFLDVYSRQHTCDVCSQTSSVGLDVKVGFASALCGCSAGGVRPYPLVNLSVSFGCVARPAVRHRFCAAHRGLASAASADAAALPKLCPGEHALRYVEADPVYGCMPATPVLRP